MKLIGITKDFKKFKYFSNKSLEVLESNVLTHKPLFQIKYSDHVNDLKCLIGPNGAGKTTLINDICNLEKYYFIFSNDNGEFFYYKNSQSVNKIVKQIRNLNRIELGSLLDKVDIVKYSNSIEFGNYKNQNNQKKNYIDISTTNFLKRDNLMSVNRRDTINQILMAYNHHSILQKLVNFNNKSYSLVLSESGDVIKNLKDNFFKGKEAAIIKKFKYDSEGKTVSSIEKVLRYKFLSYILTYISDLESITSVVTTDFKLKKNFYKESSQFVRDQKAIRVFFNFLDFLRKKEYFKNNKDRSKRFLVNNNDGEKKTHIANPDLKKFNSIFTSKESFLTEMLSVISIEWDGLSSGELSLLNLLSRLYDVVQKENSNKDKQKNILLIIDEVDIGLHPEWQRCWVSDVVPIIDKVVSNKWSNIQIVISTHSPIILSDIISDDIIYVSSETAASETFTQNIYTLFNDSFYLKKLQGEFSLKVINSLNELFEKLIDQRNISITNKSIKRFYEEIFSEKPDNINNVKEHLGELISKIGEDILRGYFSDQLDLIDWYDYEN